MNDSAAVHVEDHGRIRVLTMDHAPSLNGLSPLMRRLLMACFAEAFADGAVGAIVVTGANAAFSAGSDIAAIPGQAVVERVERLERFQDFVARWSEQPKPVIAAVEGPVAGGGVSMVLASDVAIASSEARFVGGWLQLGLAPDAGAVWSLVRTLGPKRAFDWLHGGSELGAARAEELGVVTAICEPGQALTAAIARAEIVLRAPVSARAASKRLFAEAMANPDLRSYLAVESAELAALFSSVEHLEAVEAYLRRRSR